MKTALFILLYLSIGFGVSLGCFIVYVRVNKQFYRNEQYWQIDGAEAVSFVGVACVWPMVVLALPFWAIGKLLVKMLAKIEKEVNRDEGDESICDGDSCPIQYSADEFFSAERGDGR